METYSRHHLVGLGLFYSRIVGSLCDQQRFHLFHFSSGFVGVAGVWVLFGGQTCKRQIKRRRERQAREPDSHSSSEPSAATAAILYYAAIL